MRDMEKKRANDAKRMRELRAEAAGGTAALKQLRAQVSKLVRENMTLLTEARIRAAEDEHREALQKVIAEVEVPHWLVAGEAPRGTTGVPLLELSDWHIGEVVRRELVGGKNEYNKAIAEERVKRLLKGTLDLTLHHMVQPSYPGIVVPVNGDMVSGTIHEELMVTNWGDERYVIKEAARLLIGLLEGLSDNFEEVFVPWTTGNHGRTTKKMQYKRRVGTSFDAILGDMVAEHFANRRKVRFAIAEGASLLYRVYGHRYLLTHGDPASTGAKGGDGIIGAAGPIIRGLTKLLAQAGQLGMDFDTLVLGHFHWRFLTDEVIVNGSLKGFDELAKNSGYRYAPASQNLWFTHPERGPTAYWPVYVDPKGEKYQGSWSSLFKEVP